MIGLHRPGCEKTLLKKFSEFMGKAELLEMVDDHELLRGRVGEVIYGIEVASGASGSSAPLMVAQGSPDRQPIASNTTTTSNRQSQASTNNGDDDDPPNRKGETPRPLDGVYRQPKRAKSSNPDDEDNMSHNSEGSIHRLVNGTLHNFQIEHLHEVAASQQERSHILARLPRMSDFYQDYHDHMEVKTAGKPRYQAVP